MAGNCYFLVNGVLLFKIFQNIAKKAETKKAFTNWQHRDKERLFLNYF